MLIEIQITEAGTVTKSTGFLMRVLLPTPGLPIIYQNRPPELLLNQSNTYITLYIWKCLKLKCRRWNDCLCHILITNLDKLFNISMPQFSPLSISMDCWVNKITYVKYLGLCLTHTQKLMEACIIRGILHAMVQLPPASQKALALCPSWGRNWEMRLASA